MPVIGIIILAAGASTRLGTPKQLLPYHGRSLLRHAAETALATECGPIVVVLGAQAQLLLTELHDLPVQTAENPGWEQGMGSSLRIGMQTLLAPSTPEMDAVLIMLCDQPLLTPTHLNSIINIFITTITTSSITTSNEPHPLIVASEYNQTSGVPALFSSHLFAELANLTGKEGAKQLLQRHRDKILTVPLPEAAIDIDTQEDYRRLNT